MSLHAIEALIGAAVTVRERAHAPYTGFKVGAAIRDESGAVHSAAHVEKAPYPMSQCAEASAIGAMIAAGGREIREIPVVGEGDALGTPCRGCLQQTSEFAAPSASIHVGGLEGHRRTFALSDLLPASFGPENLD